MSYDLEMQHKLEALAIRLEQESGRRLADLGEEDDWSAILTWDGVRNALAQNVTVGSHTVNHVRLGLVETEVAETNSYVPKR